MRSKRLVLFVSAVCAGAIEIAARTTEQPGTTAEVKATAYLVREVPAWRRNHPCYSCHNNGDAARALIAAAGRAETVRAALDDTLAWVGDPKRWDSNGGGEGGADDKRLARIQFAHATASAAAAGLLPSSSVAAASAIVAADQQEDGSWRLDSSDSIGSPATYGTALATAVARRTLIASGMAAHRERIDRAAEWLGRTKPDNVPDATAIVFAFADISTRRPGNWEAALTLLRQGQGRDGGWGPYVTSPAEPFDTALAMIALHSIARSPTLAEPAFAGSALADVIDKGRTFLLRTQYDDGSWPETTRPAGQSSYAQRISTTAWALLALIETRDTNR